MSVGTPAIIADAMSMLYCLRPIVTLTMLLSATVIGELPPAVKETPKRKSFQIEVNCQMQETTIMGTEAGSMMLQKIRKKSAPSITAALVNSSGTETK